jgi:short-subunit dehydrogenase
MAQKLVLVTGASSGIGEATANAYAARGARLLLLARNLERLEGVAGAIRQQGGTVAAFAVDLSDGGAVTETAARILREAGAPDILINNAGIGRWLPFLQTTLEEARAMIEVPYLAAFYLTRTLLPQMLARGSGAIANVGSPASYLAWRNACAYIAARHAVLGFTEALRADLAGTGLSVTMVVLGTVETPYWEHNPGSRENLPKVDPRLVPTLTAEEAAAAIVEGVDKRRRTVVKPAIYRALFLMNALAPGLVARQLRRATRPRNPAASRPT